MELSSDVTNGLKLIADTSKIPEKCFVILLKNAINTLTESKRFEPPHGTAVDGADLKLAFAALTTALLEAAKLDKDELSLSHVLEECNIDASRCAHITNAYRQSKEHMRSTLARVGCDVPHIVDVDWRLDYCIKNNQVEHGQPVFLIQLKTEVPGKDGLDDVQLTCTHDQLQDLVGKLRDACKSLERTAQM